MDLLSLLGGPHMIVEHDEHNIGSFSYLAGPLSIPMLTYFPNTIHQQLQQQNITSLFPFAHITGLHACPHVQIHGTGALALKDLFVWMKASAQNGTVLPLASIITDPVRYILAMSGIRTLDIHSLDHEISTVVHRLQHEVLTCDQIGRLLATSPRSLLPELYQSIVGHVARQFCLGTLLDSDRHMVFGKLNAGFDRDVANNLRGLRGRKWHEKALIAEGIWIGKRLGDYGRQLVGSARGSLTGEKHGIPSVEAAIPTGVTGCVPDIPVPSQLLPLPLPTMQSYNPHLVDQLSAKTYCHKPATYLQRPYLPALVPGVVYSTANQHYADPPAQVPMISQAYPQQHQGTLNHHQTQVPKHLAPPPISIPTLQSILRQSFAHNRPTSGIQYRDPRSPRHHTERHDRGRRPSSRHIHFLDDPPRNYSDDHHHPHISGSSHRYDSTRPLHTVDLPASSFGRTSPAPVLAGERLKSSQDLGHGRYMHVFEDSSGGERWVRKSPGFRSEGSSWDWSRTVG